MAKIAILGCGFGSALAVMTNKYGHEVTLWSRSKEEIETIKKEGELKTLLKGVKIAKDIILTNDIECVKGKDIVILAIPSVAMRSVARSLRGILDAQTVVVSVAKGFELGTLKTMSEIINEEVDNVVVALSGPSHAEEIARGVPTTIVSASTNEEASKYIRDILSNENLRIYSSDDIVGVQLGGALKNVIALAAGIIDGLGYGDNAKAALLTRGLNEMASLGVHYGARKETFAGLTGIGDLIVTCYSKHSRNNRCGILIGKGMSAKEAVAEIGMTVEGYTTAKSAYELMNSSGVPMPIIEQIYAVLYHNKKPIDAVTALMSRPIKDESDTNWLI